MSTNVNVDRCWAILESLNWPAIAKVKGRVSSASIQRKMIKSYSSYHILEACRFARTLRANLEKAYDVWCHTYQTRPGSFGGDDSFGDMMWHVIGMGREYYNMVLTDFNLLNSLDYREGFQYLMIEDRRDLEEFELHYHMTRCEQALGKLTVMAAKYRHYLNDPVYLELRDRFIAILKSDCEENTTLSCVRDLAGGGQSAAYQRFYTGWEHNESAYFANVLSDMCSHLFDEEDLNLVISISEQDRQYLVNALRNMIDQVNDPEFNTFELHDDSVLALIKRLPSDTGLFSLTLEQ
jgi:hypothetical protein